MKSDFIIKDKTATTTVLLAVGVAIGAATVISMMSIAQNAQALTIGQLIEEGLRDKSTTALETKAKEQELQGASQLLAQILNDQSEARARTGAGLDGDVAS
jgi:ABC-type lipoprotein release transport system permease subunit